MFLYNYEKKINNNNNDNNNNNNNNNNIFLIIKNFLTIKLPWEKLDA